MKKSNIISLETTEINNILKAHNKKINKINHDILKTSITNFKKNKNYKQKNKSNFNKYADKINIFQKLEDNKPDVTENTEIKIIDNLKKVNIKYIPFKEKNNKNLLILSSILFILIFAIFFFLLIQNSNFDKIKNKTINESKIDYIKIINENSILYFKKNEALLMDNENEKLELLIKALKNFKKANIAIEGYTANVEKPQNEILLSQKRALYIKNLLDSKISNNNIITEVKGLGSKNQITNDPSKFNLNRRVEIKLISFELK